MGKKWRWPTELNSRYAFVSNLGRGAMGQVVEAKDLVLKRHVAIKFQNLTQDPTIRARYEREAESLARVFHPHIVQVLGSGVCDGQFYLVMEQVQGTSYEGLCGDEQARKDWFTLAHAIQAVHEKDLIHRDIKPANAMRDTGGRPVLIDFGLSRQMDRRTLTQEGEVIGSLGYLAPEMLQGERVGIEIDWYAWAVGLFWLVEGNLPFSNHQIMASLQNAPRGTPQFQKIDLDHPDRCLLEALLSEERKVRAPAWRHVLRSKGAEPYLSKSNKSTASQASTGGSEPMSLPGSAVFSDTKAKDGPSQGSPQGMRISWWGALVFLCISSGFLFGFLGNSSKPQSGVPILPKKESTKSEETPHPARSEFLSTVHRLNRLLLDPRFLTPKQSVNANSDVIEKHLQLFLEPRLAFLLSKHLKNLRTYLLVIESEPEPFRESLRKEANAEALQLGFLEVCRRVLSLHEAFQKQALVGGRDVLRGARFATAGNKVFREWRRKLADLLQELEALDRSFPPPLLTAWIFASSQFTGTSERKGTGPNNIFKEVLKEPADSPYLPVLTIAASHRLFLTRPEPLKEPASPLQRNERCTQAHQYLVRVETLFRRTLDIVPPSENGFTRRIASLVTDAYKSCPNLNERGSQRVTQSIVDLLESKADQEEWTASLKAGLPYLRDLAGRH